MYWPLRHRYLQAVVVGKIGVRQPRDVGQVRKLLKVGLSLRLEARVRAAAGATGDAKVSRSAWTGRVSPPTTKRRLIQIAQSDQLRAVVTNVSNVKREVIREGALDAQTPRSDIGGAQITVHTH